MSSDEPTAERSRSPSPSPPPLENLTLADAPSPTSPAAEPPVAGPSALRTQSAPAVPGAASVEATSPLDQASSAAPTPGIPPRVPGVAAGRPQFTPPAGRVPGGPIVGRPGGFPAPGGMRPGGRGPGPIAGTPMGMRAGMGAGGAAQMQTRLPPSLQAKMDKLAAQRSGTPSPTTTNGAGPTPQATSMGALLRAQAMRAGQTGGAAGPNAGPLGLAARRSAGRPPMTLGSASTPGAGPPRPGGLAGRRGPAGGLSLAQMQGAPEPERSKFNDFHKIMDPSGSLKFSKAVLHAGGVDFGDGQSFKINMDEMEVLGELGKGNYGSVQKVFHRPTGVVMAMKEIRLELDESKLSGIIMELDILHRAVAPEIVEFYGAFTIESCVYYCMEFMDAGSLDKLTGNGTPAVTSAGKAGDAKTSPAEAPVPEPVLRRITAAIVRGLRFLKDELQIMHRDVKPTNVLMNRKGEIKLCDFGVSGQLEKSLAKTNIGCQSYMAPERIKGESQNQVSTYTVSSDVWSVGLSLIEIATGTYPYPPETYTNVFAQLTAIVNGPAPTLPDSYSEEARDFVAQCLRKDPNARPTYAELLEHPWLLADKDADVDMPAWVAHRQEVQASRGIVPLAEVEV